MIRTAELCCLTGGSSHDFRSVMPADVKESAKSAVRSTDDNDGFAGDRAGHVGA